MKLTIDPEFRSLIPPLTDEERRQLEANVRADGCRDPLVVWNGKNILLDGHNRNDICERFGIPFKTSEKHFEDRDAAKVWIINNQFGRRNLTLFQRAELGLKLEPLLAAKAKERQRGGRGGMLLQNSGQAKGTTEKDIAKVAGVSHDTIHKAKVIAAKAPEPVKEQLRRGETSINSVYTDIRRKEKEDRREERRESNRKLINAAPAPTAAIKSGAKFSTIVIDPPWDWGDEGDVDQLGRARPVYGTMPFDEVKALPVAKLADDDCHLYLWITNRSLPKGFALLDAWGFRYVTCLTWCKPSIGMGNYFRGSTEQVLFAVKGSQPLKRKNVGTWFTAPRGADHSSKPAEFFELVESCSPGPLNHRTPA